MNIDNIRKLVNDTLNKDMHHDAIFYADKLVSITNDLNDMKLLIKSYILGRQYKRAVLFLKNHNLLDNNNNIDDLSFQFLACRCLAEVNEWSECLVIFGVDDDEVSGILDLYDRNLNIEQQNRDESSTITTNICHTSSLKLTSSIALLRAKAYRSLENHERMIRWLQDALYRDCKCVEAFDMLVEMRNLKYEDEMKLLHQLNIPNELNWLKLMYETKIEQFFYKSDNVPEKIEILENQFQLKDNNDLKASLAAYHYQRYQFEESYELTKTVFQSDPYHHTILPIHLCVMVELSLKAELFYCAHQLVEAYPDDALTWFAVGCYYFLIGNFEVSRRYFSKATTIDRFFASAWIGVGHSFAAADESDQAMSAYRTASRLFEGSHIPFLCIGMEYARSTQSQFLASQFFTDAHAICPVDPLIYNEIGIVSYNEHDYDSAIHYFNTALEQMPKTRNKAIESILINLGHAYRKMRKYKNAIESFEKALGVAHNNASIYSALGVTYHLWDNLTKAIEYYHKSLGLRPSDTFTSDALAKAFEERFKYEHLIETL